MGNHWKTIYPCSMFSQSNQPSGQFILLVEYNRVGCFEGSQSSLRKTKTSGALGHFAFLPLLHSTEVDLSTFFQQIMSYKVGCKSFFFPFNPETLSVALNVYCAFLGWWFSRQDAPHRDFPIIQKGPLLLVFLSTRVHFIALFTTHAQENSLIRRTHKS